MHDASPGCHHSLGPFSFVPQLEGRHPHVYTQRDLKKYVYISRSTSTSTYAVPQGIDRNHIMGIIVPSTPHAAQFSFLFIFGGVLDAADRTMQPGVPSLERNVRMLAHKDFSTTFVLAVSVFPIAQYVHDHAGPTGLQYTLIDASTFGSPHSVHASREQHNFEVCPPLHCTYNLNSCGIAALNTHLTLKTQLLGSESSALLAELQAKCSQAKQRNMVVPRL